MPTRLCLHGEESAAAHAAARRGAQEMLAALAPARLRDEALAQAKRARRHEPEHDRGYVHAMDRVLENIWVHLHRFIERRDEVAGTVSYYTWSDDQEKAFLDYMGAVAPSLYGNDWITHATRVCALWGWSRTSLYQLKRWSRRSGKTYSTVAFVAAYLMCTADDMGIGIYSQGQRASTEFMQQVYDFINRSAFYTEGRIVAYTQGGHTPTISVASLLVPGVIVSAYAYPSSEKVCCGCFVCVRLLAVCSPHSHTPGPLACPSWGTTATPFFDNPKRLQLLSHKYLPLFSDMPYVYLTRH